MTQIANSAQRSVDVAASLSVPVKHMLAHLLIEKRENKEAILTRFP